MKIGNKDKKKKPKIVSGKSKGFKKTGKMKLGKKKKRITQSDMIRKPYGGHLPFPPKDCCRKEYIFSTDYIPWIDLGLCISCPDYGEKGCERKREYLSEMDRLRKEYFKGKEK